MPLVKTLFWGSLGALAWTHVGYPAAAGIVARLRPRPVRKDESYEPDGDGDRRRTQRGGGHRAPARERARARLPGGETRVVVASDASEDRTDELVEGVAAQERRVRLLACPRGGKVAAQNLAVRETEGDIVAFSDANATWAPDALRRLVANLADPEVGYVCGRLRLEAADGSNQEGLYWRYELWLREQESACGSITGGNGSIYALPRADYVEVDPRFGHDLALPYLMVQRGRRAVYEPSAVAFEKPTPTNETEYRRKVRMFEHCWLITLRGSMVRRLPPGYLAEIVSHRVLRYGSGVLHLVLLGASIALAADGWPYQAALAGQVALVVAAAAGQPVARYYTLVSWATVQALANYVRRGVPAGWDPAATR